MFGAKRRRATELAQEVLRPARVDIGMLEDVSRQNLEAEMLRLVRNGQEDAILARQHGNRRDEEYDDRKGR